MKKLLPILICLTALLTAACNRFGENNLPAPTSLQSFTPTAVISKRWSHNVGSGDHQQNLRYSMVLYSGQLFTVDYKGGVEVREAQSGQRVWKQSLAETITSGLAVSDTLVSAVSEKGTLYALDRKSGKLLWQTTLSNQALAAPTFSGEKIFVKTIDEQVSAIDSKTGEVLWVFGSTPVQMILRFGGSPIVVGDRVIVGTVMGKVFALNVADGTIIWEQVIAMPKGMTEVQQMVDIDMAPLVEKDELYVASYQGNIAALQLETGVVLWHHTFSTFTGMALAGNELYASDASSHLWRINAASGVIDWQQDKLAYRGLSAPTLLGKWVLVADREGYLHVLSRETGEMAARVKVAKEPILSTPIVQGNALYVLSQQGTLSAYDIR